MFSKVIMNPAYKGSLHLKILSTVIKNCPKAEIVNLSPCDGFLNMNVATKLNSQIAPHIESITVISEAEAGRLFNIYISSKLGIMFLKPGAKGFAVEHKNLESIVKKLRKTKSIRSSINCYDKQPTRPFVMVQGDYGYAKGWHYTLKQLFEGTNVTAKMAFDTQEEVDNFIKTTTETWPYKLMFMIDDNSAVISHLPFLGDYTHPWTDKDLYNKFGLTEDEIEEIECSVKS